MFKESLGESHEIKNIISIYAIFLLVINQDIDIYILNYRLNYICLNKYLRKRYREFLGFRSLTST